MPDWKMEEFILGLSDEEFVALVQIANERMADMSGGWYVWLAQHAMAVAAAAVGGPCDGASLELSDAIDELKEFLEEE